MTLPLIRLLQLTSPALPVGAYTYSQGLEWAVEQGIVCDEPSAQTWIGDLLAGSVGRFEAPWLGRFLIAWNQEDAHSLGMLHAHFLASRETAELRAETLQMGHSLTRLLEALAGFPKGHVRRLQQFAQPSYPLAWSCAASAWQIDAPDALAGYLWSWAENQVLAAVKTVPLGQSAGQRILAAVGSQIPLLVEHALVVPADATSNFSPGLAIASACHETQYTRLFRS